MVRTGDVVANPRDTSAFFVERQGGAGRAVLASDWWAALGQVLRDEGVLTDTSRMVIQVSPAGAVARVDGQVWQVRPHHAEPDVEAVRSAASVEKACARALDAAMEAIPSESGAVLRAQRGYLRFLAVRGPHGDALLGVRLPASTGVAGRAAQTQRTVVVGDATGHPRHFDDIDRITGYQTRQIIAVPVIDGGVLQAVIELINPEEGVTVNRQTLKPVETIGRVLGTYLSRRPTRRRG